MKRILLVALVEIGAWLCCTGVARAVQAPDVLFPVTQPDGAVIQLKARGDEFFSWYQTPEGHPVEQDAASQEWRYLDPATQGLTSLVVGREKAPSPAPWRPQPSAAVQARLQSMGTPVRSVPLPIDRGFVVGSGDQAQAAGASVTGAMATLCAKFSDTQNQPVYPTSTFRDLLFDTTPGKLSMTNLYIDMSFGTFTATGGPSGVRGWYVLPGTRASYAGDNPVTKVKDVNTIGFLVDLIAQADANFNFGPYDTDNDGYVDCLAVIAQGRGQEGGGGTDAFWAHQYSISELRGGEYSTKAQPTNDVNALGNPVYVDRYFICNERLVVDDDPKTPANEASTSPQQVGVFCHEYGHALGLPDLYDHDGNDGNGSSGLGGWSLMGGGNWNADSISGDHPCWMDAWSRAKLGWVTVERITTNIRNFEIPETKTSGKAFRLWTNGNLGKQYFLVENRQLTGFDARLPGKGGLMIYHIDDNVKTGNDKEWWWKNGVGTGGPTHYLVALEQADGKFNLERTTDFDPATGEGSNGGDDGDTWVSGNSFDIFTTPSSNAYITSGSGIGSPSYVGVWNISAAGPLMTADFYVRPDREFPEVAVTTPAVNDELHDHLSEFAGTASDPDALQDVYVYLQEDKPEGRYWNWSAHLWQSVKNNTGQKGAVQFQGGGTSWLRPMDDDAFVDGHYRLTVTAVDTFASSSVVERRFRIQRDMSAPNVTVNSPGTSPLRAVPVITGTAQDETGVKEKHFRLRSVTLNCWYNFSPATPGFTPGDPVQHQFVDLTPNQNWSFPLPLNLPNGSYEFTAEAIDANDLLSPPRTISFELKVAPVVMITAPVNGRYVKVTPLITGTAEAPAGATIQGGRVTLIIQRGTEYWTGNGWSGTETEVHADLNASHQWTYPSSSSDLFAETPVGDGYYVVTVKAADTEGRNSMPVQAGLTGANAVTFTVDTVPPNCVINSPADHVLVTAPPLTASGFFHGYAADATGKPVVTLYLKRLSDNQYWNSLAWKSDQASAGVPAAFAGGPEGSLTDWFYAQKFPRLGTKYGNLTNGEYELTVKARDLAGNETVRVVNMTVDWNPVWLRPQDELVTLLPAQTAPVPPDGVATTVHQTFAPRWSSSDFATYQVSMLGLDGAGNAYVVSAATSLSDGTGAVLQRVGPGGWRRQRSVTVVPGPNLYDPSTYFEDWGGGVPSYQLSSDDGYYRSYFTASAVDAAGNLFAAYSLGPPVPGQTFHTTQLLLVKFDSSGNLLWRKIVESAVAAVKLLPTSNGGVALLGKASSSVFGGVYSEAHVMNFSSGGNLVGSAGFGHESFGDFQPQLLVEPMFLDADSAGNLYVTTQEQSDGSASTYLELRKLNAAGQVLNTFEVETGETPELWLDMKADAAGNVYVASSFDVSPVDRRICLTKYDTSLNVLWRAFGPALSMTNDQTTVPPFSSMRITPEGITISHGAQGQGYYSEFPYDHGRITRFNTAGDMLWSRGIKGTEATVLHGDFIQEMQVDNAGNVLILAVFNTPDGSGRFCYGKVANNGDLQFLKLLPSVATFFPFRSALYQGTQLLTVNFFGDGAAFPDDNMQLVLFDNPANVLIPVTLDPAEPADQTVIAGATVKLRSLNSGSPATYVWRKEDELGVPQVIAGAAKDTLILSNVALADQGRYSVVATNALGPATSRTAQLTVLSSVPIAEALDTPGRTWTTSADAPWVGYSPTPAHDGADAAMPANIGHGKTSWLETKVTGPGTVTFWWKSSTQMFGDVADFSVDGESKAELSGIWDWQVVTVTFEGAGQHTLRWAYVKDSDILGGQDRIWLDQVSFSTPLALEVALDTPGRTWTTSGNANWTGATSPSHDGVDAAVSGPIIGNQETSMETKVIGPGTLSFWWKVSSEDGFDFLKFTVDNVTYASATGFMDWTKITRPISGEGEHTLKWTYSKDAVFNAGQDRGWVDQVVFTASGPAPPVAVTVPATSVGTETATLKGEVNPSSLATTVVFHYGLAEDALTSTTSTINLTAGVSSIAVARTLAGLTAATTYYYRVKATNSQDTSYGEVLSFTTNDYPEIELEAPEGVAVADGGAVDFGSAGVGSVVVRDFVVKNSGDGPLSGLVVTIDGTHQADFAVVVPPDGSVAPGGETSFRVRFIAGAVNARAAKLHIASNDPDESPFDIDLAGTGLAPPAGAEIEVEQPLFTSLVDDATVDFGSVPMSGTAALSFTVRSVGAAGLTGVAASVIGAHPTNFVLTSKPAASIAAKGFSTFIVSFKPTALGDRSATLRIASNDANENPFDVHLIGEARAAVVPMFTVSPVAQMLPLGSEAVFHSAATGDPAPTYQWRKGSTSINGAKSADYTIPELILTHAGTYYAQAANGAGMANSLTAELGVVEVAPKTHLLASGGNVSFTANAAGKNLVYVWMKDGMALNASAHYVDVKKKTLMIKGLQVADNGVYSCEVTGDAGVLSSGGQTVVVFNQKPDITPLANGDALPAGIVSRYYSYQVPVDPASSKTPTSFAATGLPPGMKIDATGLISGTPTAAKMGAGGVVNSYAVKISASNSKGKDEVAVTLLIAPLPAGALGKFEGPILRSPSLNANLGGRFDLETKTTGSFTGKIALGATTYGFAGVLATDAAGLMPQATANVVVNKVTLFTVTFAIDTANNRIDTGNITDGAGNVAFTAWRKIWTTAVTPAGLTGYYTFAVDLADVAPEAPQGNGFGMLTVNPTTGALSLSIKTFDDESFLATPVLGPQGQILVHQLLYGTPKGSFTGSLLIGKGTNAADDSDNTLTGTLSASRPPNSPAKTRAYNGGFGPVNLNLAGGRFIQPPLVLGVTAGPNNAKLVFNDAGIGMPAPGPGITLGIGALNAITYPLPAATANPRKTSLKLTPKTGEFSGTFTLDDPPAAKRVVDYQGVIIQDGAQQRGYGYFMLPQLPSAGPPATTTATSPILSGQVIFERP